MIVIVVALVIGVGIVGKSLMQKTVQRQSSSLPAGWQTYKNDTYGYSVSYPKDWKAEDKSSNTSRRTTVYDPKGTAYIDIQAFKDDSMKDQDAIQKAITAMEAKLRSNPALTVKQFKGQAPKSGEKVGGYIAAGEETIKGVSFSFDNRGLLDTYGKVLLFHSSAKKDLAKDLNPTLSQIVKSFTVE